MNKESNNAILFRELAKLSEGLKGLTILEPFYKFRIKTKKSIEEKFIESQLSKNTLHDIIGIQVCSILSKDIPVICEHIEQNFNVINNSIYNESNQPKRRMEVFRSERYYFARHYIVRVQEGVLLEIQVNTIFQRIVADYLHYKVFYKPLRKFSEEELRLIDSFTTRVKNIENGIKELIEKLKIK